MKPEDRVVQDMEKKLRRLIKENRDILLNMTIAREKSRDQFLSTVVDIVSELDRSASRTPDTNAEKMASAKRNIKLVSIDVPKRSVHGILFKTRESASKNFLTMLLPDTSQHSKLSKKKTYPGNGFVPMTHVTMAHCSRTNEHDMRRLFGAVLGCQVILKAKSILWSDRVAALAVDIPRQTSKGLSLQPSANAFAHITIWHSKQASAVEANDLPELVSKGDAHLAHFQHPIDLSGSISYWDKKNRSFTEDD